MEKEIRPVAIDCANLACAYVYNANNLGDSLGPVSAYKYWKKLGHEVKVFVLQTKIYNKLIQIKRMGLIKQRPGI